MNLIQKWILKRISLKAKPFLQSYGMLQTVKIFNKSAIVWEPAGKKILVLAPHMDDEVVGCGGTIAKHVRSGAEVTVVFITDGRTGSKSLSGLSGEERINQELKTVELRKKEAEQALKTLNIKNWIFLDAENSALSSNKQLSGRIRQILLDIKPDLVYLPFFLEEHPEHRITNQILMDAAENTNLHFYCLGYEVWTPLFPNCLVKIDDTIEIKKQALMRYESQIADHDYLHTSLGLNAYRSTALLDDACKFAEAFFMASLNDYSAVYRSYCK